MDNLAFDRAVAERVRVDAIQARKDRRAKRWRFAWTLVRVVGLALLLAAAYAIGRASVLVNC